MKVKHVLEMLKGCNGEAELCVFVSEDEYSPVTAFTLKPAEDAGPSDIIIFAEAEPEE